MCESGDQQYHWLLLAEYVCFGRSASRREHAKTGSHRIPSAIDGRVLRLIREKDNAALPPNSRVVHAVASVVSAAALSPARTNAICGGFVVHACRSMTHAFFAQRSCLITFGLLVLVSLLSSRTVSAQSVDQPVSRGFLDVEVGVVDAVDKQWVNSRSNSLGLSVARRFPMNRNSTLFAGVELAQTGGNSELLCSGPAPGECRPEFPEFGFVGVLFGAELRGGRLSGSLTVSPGKFFSRDSSGASANPYGVQAGIGGALEIVRHVALTVKFRRAFLSSYEPYSANFTNRAIGLRFQ